MFAAVGLCALGVAWALSMMPPALAQDNGSQVDPVDQDHINSDQTVARWSGDGVAARYLKVRYRIDSPDGSVPGIISVYAQSGTSADPNSLPKSETLVDHILPFAPAGENGVRTSIIQVPANLSNSLSTADPVSVMIELDRTGNTPPDPAVKVQLLDAEVIRGENQ